MNNTTLTKICCQCITTKPIDQFENNIDFYPICKSCYPNNNKKIINQYVHQIKKIHHTPWASIPLNNIKIEEEELRNKILTKSRNIVRTAMQQNNINSKLEEKIKELVGCSSQTLRNHMEKLWKIGMNWNNYGSHGWVVDHIYPCHRFNVLDPTELKICFYYKNLQPLSFGANCAKSSLLLPIYKNHQII